jgi:hypothetical protein
MRRFLVERTDLIPAFPRFVEAIAARIIALPVLQAFAEIGIFDGIVFARSAWQTPLLTTLMISSVSVPRARRSAASKGAGKEKSVHGVGNFMMARSRTIAGGRDGPAGSIFT